MTKKQSDWMSIVTHLNSFSEEDENWFRSKPVRKPKTGKKANHTFLSNRFLRRTG